MVPELVGAAFRANVANPNRKIILIALAWHADRNYHITIYPDQFAQDLGYQPDGVQTVVDHINDLDDEYLESVGGIEHVGSTNRPRLTVDLTKLLARDAFEGVA